MTSWLIYYIAMLTEIENCSYFICVNIKCHDNYIDIDYLV